MTENELRHFGVKGMKWGVRRYQNYDGTLTDAGARRLEKDRIKNNRKKNKDRYTESGLNDPDRWAREDLEKAKKIGDVGLQLTRELQNFERSTRKKTTKPRMDLSNMTDKELRDRINRELTERQYNDLFNTAKPSDISAGRKTVSQVLAGASGVLAAGSSALSIALAIKQLKE